MTQQCHWFIHVRPGHKVLLYFEEFEVEGKPEGESDRFLGKINDYNCDNYNATYKLFSYRLDFLT